MPPVSNRSFAARTFGVPSLKRVFRAYTITGMLTPSLGAMATYQTEFAQRTKPSYQFTPPSAR